MNENPTFRLGEYYFGSDTFDNSTAGGLANLETYAVLASPTNGPDEVSAVTSQVYLAQSPNAKGAWLHLTLHTAENSAAVADGSRRK